MARLLSGLPSCGWVRRRRHAAHPRLCRMHCLVQREPGAIGCGAMSGRDACPWRALRSANEAGAGQPAYAAGRCSGQAPACLLPQGDEKFARRPSHGWLRRRCHAAHPGLCRKRRCLVQRGHSAIGCGAVSRRDACPWRALRSANEAGAGQPAYAAGRCSGQAPACLLPQGDEKFARRPSHGWLRRRCHAAHPGLCRKRRCLVQRGHSAIGCGAVSRRDACPWRALRSANEAGAGQPAYAAGRCSGQAPACRLPQALGSRHTRRGAAVAKRQRVSSPGETKNSRAARAAAGCGVAVTLLIPGCGTAKSSRVAIRQPGARSTGHRGRRRCDSPSRQRAAPLPPEAKKMPRPRSVP